MQQLTYSIFECAETPDHWIVECTMSYIPDWEVCQQDVNDWLLSLGFIIKEFSLGADRFSWRLDLAGLICMFHVEFLTETFWFDCDDAITRDTIVLGLVN